MPPCTSGTPSAPRATSLLTKVRGSVSQKCLKYVGFTHSRAGFINQFGTVHNAQTGALELNASHISLWAGFSYVAQIATQILSPITGDRYGRRFNMYCFTIAMVIAIILEIVAKDWKVYLAAKVSRSTAGQHTSTLLTSKTRSLVDYAVVSLVQR